MKDVLRNSFGKIFDRISSNFEKYLTIYVCINVAWIFFGIFFYDYAFFKFSYQNYSTSYILLFIINFLIFIFSCFFKKIRFKRFDFLILFLIVFGFFSTIFSSSISISLFGTWRRFEGYFQLLYYYSLLFLSSLIVKDNFKELIIRFILFFGLVNVFICFLQVFDVLSFIKINMRGISLGQGLVTNSNFFGSYMILCLGLGIGMYLFNDKIISKIIYLFMSFAFYFGLLMSNALSGMIGFCGIFLFLIIYFIYMFIKKNIIKKYAISLFVICFGFLIISIVLSINGKTVMFDDLKRFSNETREISKGNISDDYGSARIYIWKNAIRVVPNNLFFGVGVDNFLNAFDKPLILKTSETQITYFDKVHNEYLQKLVCEGVFSCITYIVMLFMLFVKNAKNIIKEQNYISIALFFAFVGYSVQAFFNISVIEVAPLFWIVIGLLYDRNVNCDKKL